VAVGRKRDILVAGALGVVFAVALVSSIVVIDRVTRDAKISDRSDPRVGTVLTPTRNVQAGEAMDSLLDAGEMMEIDVPRVALVDGAATDVSQLEGKTTTRPIGKGEQISLHYLSE
jgi:hypothetical protein